MNNVTNTPAQRKAHAVGRAECSLTHWAFASANRFAGYQPQAILYDDALETMHTVSFQRAARLHHLSKN